MDDTPEAADAEWNEAVLAHNGERAAAIVHKDYALLVEHPQRARVERKEWLAMLPVYVIHSWEVIDSEWDLLGDVAVHSQLVRQSATVMGGDRSGLFAIADTWVHDGTWQVRLRYSTPLTAGSMPRME